MSGLIDRTYVNYLAVRLERFKWVRGNLAVCRCPLCGDGRRGNKTRFYIYQDVKHGTYLYNVQCKNCGHSESFNNFLKNYDSSLYSQYRMEKFRDKFGREPRNFFEPDPPEVVVPKEKRLQLEKLEGTVTVDSLPDSHLCKQYVISRQLPKNLWDKLLYAEDFQGIVTKFVSEEYAKKMPNDPRLVIPFYDAFGYINCFQGRSLDPECKMRYISVKRNDTVEKIYGLDRVDRSKTVYVVEGPIDSMFIPNALAAADADLLRVKGDVYIFDSQYRNREVCKLIEKAIEQNVKVVLFPDDIPFKDINDMIVKGGMTLDEIMQVIKANTFSGLRAKLQFAKLKRT